MIVLKHSTFLHATRTGGLAIGKWLRRNKVEHIEEKPLHNIHLMEIDPDRFYFTFIRHPLAWYQSFWMRKKHKSWQVDRTCPPNLLRISNIPKMSFNDWVMCTLREDPQFYSEMMYEFIDKSDFVGRNETLWVDLKRILRTTGDYPFSTPFPEKPMERFHFAVDGGVPYEKEVYKAVCHVEGDFINRWYP